MQVKKRFVAKKISVMTTHNEFVHTAINLFIEILSTINELENIFFVSLNIPRFLFDYLPNEICLNPNVKL